MTTTDNIPVIKRTTNYGLFKFLPENREISNSNVERLTLSYSKQDLQKYRPILVTKKMEVIDGQHNLILRIKAKKPIFYIVIEEGDIETVRLLNSSVKPWSNIDYLNSYIKSGKEQYIKLRKLMNKYQLTLAPAIELFGTNGFTGVKSVKNKFRSGEYQIVNEENGSIFAEQLLDLQPFMYEYTRFNRNFLKFLHKLYSTEQIEHEDLLDRLKIQGKKIPAFQKIRDYIIFFEDVMNFRRVGRSIKLM